ncbi:hypothetical protein [Inquilinus sp. Marseille-Q2685]|uniref:hypothetical protein n=1 Tax=Inquilinus sp. Marseille-Q2685 TaxID=2866581 RepID=UPI001CE446E2|nr:hypothetical protein [Inquilinus sp. Marseille-Q2685]
MRLETFRSAIIAASLGTLLMTGVASPASAQNQNAPQVRVRGSIVESSTAMLKVKTREGQTVDVTLAQGFDVSGVTNASVTDIKPGDYVGIASLPKVGGGDGALEVLIFPPALKGAGEGSFGWDLKPNSTMTNATVADAVKSVEGRTVTVTYHGQEKTIAIPEGTPVVTFAPASQADLKPGAAVFIPAEKDASGAITAHRVVVGTNGVVPPM